MYILPEKLEVEDDLTYDRDKRKIVVRQVKSFQCTQVPYEPGYTSYSVHRMSVRWITYLLIMARLNR